MAQSAKKSVHACFEKFNKIQSYKANVHLDFDLPDINMKSKDAKVYYKKPNKFKIKSDGILFLPKQNPYESFDLLRDSNAYTAVLVNAEILHQKMCKIILVVPIKQEDIILCKLWIDDQAQLIYKMQLTTKSNGTILVEHYYGNQTQYGLPDKSIYEIEINKFKIPKVIALEMNSKKNKKAGTDEKNGTIQMSYSNYQINIPITEI